MTEHRLAEGVLWTRLDTPCLLVDLDRLETNIKDMAERSRKAGVRLRPHFKTHKSVEIAKLQEAQGISGFTVSKLDEAEVLLDAGFTDILVTTQIVSHPKVKRAFDLTKRGRLIVAVDSEAGVAALSRAAMRAASQLAVSIEVDSGLKRCGVDPEQAGQLAQAVVASGLDLNGVFTHAGHAYGATSLMELKAIAAEEIGAIATASRVVAQTGIDMSTLSIGSTPTIRAQEDYPGVNEIRPGNYVFFDAMQVALGAASRDDCALSVAATVMSRPAPDRVVLDAGSKSLGLDKGAHGVGAIDDFGQFAGREGRLVRLSEEHGVADVPVGSSLTVGDRVRIWPNHACSVANLHREYFGIRGERVEKIIPIDASGAIH